MKIKKVVSGALVLAALVTSALVASAAETMENRQIIWDMGTDYSQLTNNKVGYMYYHAGSTNWFDDIYAYTSVSVTSGMTGYASVRLEAENGTVAVQYSDTIVSNSHIKTEWAKVAGQDQAEFVEFLGARKDVNQNYVGFNYRID